MRNIFKILQCCCFLHAILAAPEGLNNRILPPPPSFNGYPPAQHQPQFIPKYQPQPCVHNNGQAVAGPASTLIQGQSQGRIVNNAHTEQSFNSAAQFNSGGLQHTQQQFQQPHINIPTAQALPLPPAPEHLHLHYNVPNNVKVPNPPAAPLPVPANHQQTHQQSFATSTSNNYAATQAQSSVTQFNGLQPPAPALPPAPLPNLNSFTPIFNNVNVHGNNGFASNFAQQSQQHVQNQGSIIAAELSSSGDSSSLQHLDSNLFDGQLGHVIRETFESTPIDPTAEKHIYVHVPPEDLEYNQEKHSQQVVPPARKHYKIIFIKTPTAAAPNYAQLQAAAAQQTEEKTLIYVLVKKPEQPSIEDIQQLQQTTTKINKPEVYFIKYKANKESGEYKAPITNSYQQSIETQSFNVGTQTSFVNEGPDAIDLRGGGGGTQEQSLPTAAALQGSYPDHDNGHSAYGVPLN